MEFQATKKAQSLDRALKLVNIWVAVIQFKPLRIKKAAKTQKAHISVSLYGNYQSFLIVICFSWLSAYT